MTVEWKAEEKVGKMVEWKAQSEEKLMVGWMVGWMGPVSVSMWAL